MSPPPVIRLHPDDGVVIARATLLPGAPVADGVAATERIPAGHKVAIRRPCRRRACAPLWAGDRLRDAADRVSASMSHVQNMGMGEFAKDYAFGQDAKPTEMIEPPATFEGIVARTGG